MFVQGQPPPDGGQGDEEKEQTDDKKQKENMAYAKKVVLRLAGLMGVGGAVSVVYVFGEFLLMVIDEPFYPTFCWSVKGDHGEDAAVGLSVVVRLHPSVQTIRSCSGR